MITIERIIPYPQKLDINTMNQTPVPLSEEDITDIRTNKDISLKLVDADGITADDRLELNRAGITGTFIPFLEKQVNNYHFLRL